ncbi:hypothetical protein CDL15_Pgr015559 [Punica granatum]|nr:hypothetical protein CDL15_Pgr015559 [Punica granatum]
MPEPQIQCTCAIYHPRGRDARKTRKLTGCEGTFQLCGRFQVTAGCRTMQKVESFDPKTSCWEQVSTCPGIRLKGTIIKSLYINVMDGNNVICNNSGRPDAKVPKSRCIPANVIIGAFCSVI